MSSALLVRSLTGLAPSCWRAPTSAEHELCGQEQICASRTTEISLIFLITGCLYVSYDVSHVQLASAQFSLGLVMLTFLLTLAVCAFRLMQWGWMPKLSSFFAFITLHHGLVISIFAVVHILCHVYQLISLPFTSPCRIDLLTDEDCAQQRTVFITAIAGLTCTQLVCSVLLRDIQAGVFLGLWVLSVVAIIVVLVLTDNVYGLYAVGVYIVCGIAIHYESHHCHMEMFRLAQRLEEVRADNEQLTKKKHTEGMFLMGNVAHDLKTPLTSFLSGVEFISSVVGDIEIKIQENDSFMVLREAVNSVKQCLHGIYNTSNFMTMAINRCIDFTKASRGLSLLPKYETIDLLETVSLPLQCMQDIQSNISIVFNPLPPVICSHIITDKHWLQENLLCLLSNAVKYSDSGDVTVTVRLVPTDEACDISITSPLRVKPVNGRRYPQVMPISDQDAVENITMGDHSLHYDENSAANAILSRASAGKECTYMIRVEVEDSGIGLTGEAMSNLFSPFRQAQRLAGGTGLGLFSLAKRLDALKGCYGVRGRRDGGQGSLFWFAFPYRADVEASEHGCGDREKRAAVPYRLNRPRLSSHHRNNKEDASDVDNVVLTEPLPEFAMKTAHLALLRPGYKDKLEILIVDDSASIVKMTTMTLKRMGHNISTAENGAMALRKIQTQFSQCQRPYDVVLMDLQMPVMDGLEATRRLRSWESEVSQHRFGNDGLVMEQKVGKGACYGKKVHHIVIGVSANSERETMEEAMAAGADAFMSKPFAIETFCSTLNAVQRELIATAEE